MPSRTRSPTPAVREALALADRSAEQTSMAWMERWWCEPVAGGARRGALDQGAEHLETAAVVQEVLGGR